MSTLVLLLIFALAAYLTWTRGIAFAFALVYIPVLVLLSVVKPLKLPLLPDLHSTFAVGYGVLAGIVLRGGIGRLPFKWNLLDTAMVALWMLAATAVAISQGAELGRNMIGDGFFDFLTPYLLARYSFHSAEGRRLALWSTAACALAVALMSPIEMRLWPQYFSRILDQYGLYVAPNSTPMYRFGLARAQTTFIQQMDQGNGGILLAALIGVFAATTRVGLRDWRVMIALSAAMFVSLASLSFSAFVNVALAFSIFAVLWGLRWTGRLMPLAVIGIFLGGVMLTASLLNRPLGERAEKLGQDVADSMYMRTMIVQQSWPLAQEAGLWGYGKQISKDMLDLDSVDNAYLLFILQRGWPYLLLFLAVPLIFSWRASRVWGLRQGDAQHLPLAIACAVLLTMLVAMYTIFFGFVYAKLWLILLGLTNSMLDVLEGKAVAIPDGAGFLPHAAPAGLPTAGGPAIAAPPFPAMAGRGS